MLTGSTIGAAAAQNLTHGTLPGTGRKRALIIGMAAVATMSIIATAILGSQGDTAQDDIPVLQPLHEGAATVPDTPSTDIGELAVVDPAIELEEPEPPEPPPVQPIKVQINSKPVGASVFAEGSDEPLGVTPYVYEALPADKEIKLRLDLHGYKSNVVSFRGDLSGQAQVTLHRAPRRERRPPRNSKPDDEFRYR
jgi:hypothetical protein